MKKLLLVMLLCVWSGCAFAIKSMGGSNLWVYFSEEDSESEGDNVSESSDSSENNDVIDEEDNAAIEQCAAATLKQIFPDAQAMSVQIINQAQGPAAGITAILKSCDIKQKDQDGKGDTEYFV